MDLYFCLYLSLNNRSKEIDFSELRGEVQVNVLDVRDATCFAISLRSC